MSGWFGRTSGSLPRDHDTDAASFDTAELHRERRLGEFKLDAFADAVAAGRAGGRDGFEPFVALHDIDPTFRRQSDLIRAALRGCGRFNKSGKRVVRLWRALWSDRKLHLTERL